MKNQPTKYIVKRNYNTSRTGADAFIKLIEKENRKQDKIKTDTNNNIEYTQYNIDNDNKVCYTKNSFKESCVIPINHKEE